MRGPYLPLYGSGAIMMLLVSMPFQDNILMVYVAGCIGATVLEYVTGVAMEALFKVRYWDYSNQKFHFQGHICLSSSLAWGFLTILMTEVIHKPIESFVLGLPGFVLTGVTVVFTMCILGDFAMSVKTALDLRGILIKMEEAKADLLRVQKRLDVIIAVANEEITIRKEVFADKTELIAEAVSEAFSRGREGLSEGLEDLSESLESHMSGFARYMEERIEEISDTIEMHIEDLKKSIEEKLEKIKGLSQDNESGYLENNREEVGELDRKYSRNVDIRNKLGNIKSFYQKNMLRSNPTMSSKKYKEALEELKRKAASEKTDGKEDS